MTSPVRKRKNDTVLFAKHRLVPVLAAAVLTFLGGCAGLRSEPRKTVTVQQIVSMSREGIPASTIISKIRESGTLYRLKASQYAQLKSEGVPDAVLNYMQQAYIKAVRNNQALQDWNNWSHGPDGFWYGGIPYGWPYEYDFFPQEPFGGEEGFEGEHEENGFERGEGGEEGEHGEGGGDQDQDAH